MLVIGAAILWLADRLGRRTTPIERPRLRRRLRDRLRPGARPGAGDQPLRDQHQRRPVRRPDPRGGRPLQLPHGDADHRRRRCSGRRASSLAGEAGVTRGRRDPRRRDGRGRGLRARRDRVPPALPAQPLDDGLRRLPPRPGGDRRRRTSWPRRARVPAMEVMKQLRQRAIRDLVEQRPIRTQQELAAALRERGFRATQATISRDIAELAAGQGAAATGSRLRAAAAPRRRRPDRRGSPAAPLPRPAGGDPRGRAAARARHPARLGARDRRRRWTAPAGRRSSARSRATTPSSWPARTGRPPAAEEAPPALRGGLGRRIRCVPSSRPGGRPRRRAPSPVTTCDARDGGRACA